MLLFVMFFCVFSIALTAQLRSVPDSVVRKMQKQKDFRYANDSSYWLEEKQAQNRSNSLERLLKWFSQSAFLKILLYLFLIAGMLFAVYQVLIVNNFFTFSRRRRKTEKDQAEQAEDVFEHLDDKLHNAITSFNYRLAVRFLYLKTLKQLSEKHFIVLNAKSTNKDYVTQLSDHLYGNAFTQLTKMYEYVWYGEFAPDELQFNKIRENFNQFNAGR